MDNIIAVNFPRRWIQEGDRCTSCGQPLQLDEQYACSACMLDIVIDTYCSIHIGATREEARRLIEQGLAFQRSLEENLEAEA